MKTIGIIGLGSIGMRHAQNLMALNAKVLAKDPDNKVMLQAQELGLEKLQPASKVDGLIIASPTKEHAEQIKKSKFPMFVEKPIADHEVDAKNVVMVGYNLRFHACVKQARDWLPHIGKLMWADFICAQFNHKPTYMRDGVILNWSHEIDLALYLIGAGKAVASNTKLENGADHCTDILLKHDNDCSSHIHLDYDTEPQIRQGIICGEEGTIVFDLVARQAWLRDLSGNIMDHLEDYGSFDEDYQEEIEAFLDRLDNKKTIGCTAEEAAETLKICLEVRKQAGLS